MKAILGMLLLLSMAYATCLSILENTQNLTTTDYADLVRLGEIYRNAAECFEENNDQQMAYTHYLQSGNYYFNASEIYDVAGDYDKQMIWYITAGDMYRYAGRKDLAQKAYEKAQLVYSLHSSEIPGNLSMQLQIKMYKLEHVSPNNYEDTKQYVDYLRYISIGTGAVIIIVIIVMLFYLRK